MTSTPHRVQSSRPPASNAITQSVHAPPVAQAVSKLSLSLPPARPTSKHRLSTPQWLNLGLYAVGGSLALSLALGLSALQHQREALRLFSRNTAPSILTTLRIQDSLAALDASVANELLLPPGSNLDARREADDRQKKLANYWIQITRNLSYGNRESRPITTLQLGFGEYLRAIERARVWHDQGNAPKTIQAYRESLVLLDQRLLPAARALGQVKTEQQARAEAQQQARIDASRFGLVFGGLGLLGYLVSVQWFLSQRTRRTFNPALVGAMVVALGLGVDGLRSLDVSATQLAKSKTETFEALVDLRTMRTLAYSAHAEVSRALLDPVKTLDHDTAIRVKLNQIVQFSGFQTADSARLTPESGLLISVAKTLQDAEEQALVKATIETLEAYWKNYEQINQLEQQGETAAAIALTTGYQSNQLNGSFELFRNAHHKLIEVELAIFDQRLGAASQTLERLNWQLPIASIVIFGLTVWGIRPRLREYRL